MWARAGQSERACPPLEHMQNRAGLQRKIDEEMVSRRGGTLLENCFQEVGIVCRLAVAGFPRPGFYKQNMDAPLTDRVPDAARTPARRRLPRVRTVARASVFPAPSNVMNYARVKALFFSSYSSLLISPPAYLLSRMSLADSDPSKGLLALFEPNPHIEPPFPLIIMKKHRPIITSGNIHQ